MLENYRMGSKSGTSILSKNLGYQTMRPKSGDEDKVSLTPVIGSQIV